MSMAGSFEGTESTSYFSHSSMEDIHPFWFPTEKPFSKVWLSHNRPLGTLPDRDTFIRQCEPLLQDALTGVDGKALTPKQALSYLILLSEFPRILYAGTNQIWCGDALAFALAQQFAYSPDVQQLPILEQYFFLLPFYYAEDLPALQQAINRLEELLSQASDPRTEVFLERSLHHFRENALCLERFGRYPHRNDRLNRANTLEETRFLNKEQNTFLHSLVELPLHLIQTKAKRAKLSKQDRQRMRQEKDRDQEEGNSKLRILVLHGWTQNGSLLRNRVRRLRTALKDCAEFYFADAPHATQPGKEGESLCWWKMKEEDGRVTYDGLSSSLGFLENLFMTQGPFDGVLGFSQGAALAGLLAAIQPLRSIQFQFVIPISGFPVRDEEYEEKMKSKIVGLPSFHVLGENDEQVSNDRTEALAACFENPTAILSRHEGSHFAVNKWPLNELATFATEQLQRKQEREGTNRPPPMNTLEEKIRATISTSGVHTTQGLPKQVQEVFYHNPLWQRLRADNTLEWNEVELLCSQIDGELKGLSLEERVEAQLLMAWSTRDGGVEEEDRGVQFSLLILALLRLYPQPIQEHMAIIPQLGSWKDLITLLDVLDTLEAVRDEMKPALTKQIVDLFVSQLSRDRECLEKLQEDQQYTQSSVGHLSQQNLWPSKCAEETPRVKSAAGKRHRVPQQIARALYPLHIPEDYKPEDDPEGQQLVNTKRISYSFYYKLLVTISKLRQTTTKTFFDNQSNQHRLKVLRGRMSEEGWQQMLQTPISSEIIHPRPEPVVPCQLSELDSLLDFLSSNAVPQEQTAFDRGTIVPDGRLDLCKQVVGPKGILPLMQSMKGNEQVKRLLLGNNIVGNGGAQAIAEAIATNAVPNMETWYIAGNDISAEGIQPICDALAYNQTVKALWLKRNPLKAAGAVYVGQLLHTNTTITTLDLDNCGLLDEGAAHIVEGLRDNRTVQHLTINTNGLTVVSAKLFADYLGQEGCTLRTLIMGINPIGDEGCQSLASCFYQNKSLERLGLPSCRVSDAGVAALTDALAQSKHPLKFLDLGFMKATFAVKEIGNRLTDQSAHALASFLATNPPLRMISLVNHSFEEPGLMVLGKALESNTSLTSVGLTGFVSEPAYLGEHLIQRVEQNRQLALANGESEQQLNEIELPAHVEEIYSVYRTKSPAQRPFLNKFNWLQASDLKN